MYDRILVPLDGSHESELALPHARALARTFGSTVMLMQCIEPITEAYREAATPNDPEVGMRVAQGGYEAQKKAAEDYMDGIRGSFEAEGITVSAHLDSGDAAPLILEEIEKGRASLVCMTSHGRGGFKRMVLGSVTDAVLREATVPVLVIRAT